MVIASNYKLLPHSAFSIGENKNLTTLCFCKQPMVEKSKTLVCKNGKCGFKILSSTLIALHKNNLLKKKEINVPVCLDCYGSSISHGMKKEWSSYNKILYRCSCPSKMSVLDDAINNFGELNLDQQKHEIKSENTFIDPFN